MTKQKKVIEINWRKAIPLLVGVIGGGVLAFFLVRSLL